MVIGYDLHVVRSLQVTPPLPQGVDHTEQLLLSRGVIALGWGKLLAREGNGLSRLQQHGTRTTQRGVGDYLKGKRLRHVRIAEQDIVR